MLGPWKLLGSRLLCALGLPRGWEWKGAGSQLGILDLRPRPAGWQPSLSVVCRPRCALVFQTGGAEPREAGRCRPEREGGGDSRVTRESCPARSPTLPLPQDDPGSRRQSCAFGASRAGQGEGKAFLEKSQGNTNGGRTWKPRATPRRPPLL